MLRAILLRLSRSKRLKRWAMKSRLTRRMVERFIAGNDLAQAIDNGRRLNEAGIVLTMDHLGESVSSDSEADEAAAEYRTMIDRIKEQGLASTISIKPTQLGLALDPEECGRRLADVVEHGKSLGIGVEIDMEDSPYTDITLSIYEAMHRLSPGTRVCLQAYLRRCRDDLQRLINFGGSVRLVKGAYRESPTLAFSSKKQVDDQFAELTRLGLDADALEKGFYLAVATHDERLVRQTIAFAEEHRVAKDRFEFQFLYGIRSELQARLAHEGFTVRVYLPYGREWYPYFMRRLAERPANLLFLLKNLFKK